VPRPPPVVSVFTNVPVAQQAHTAGKPTSSSINIPGIMEVRYVRRLHKEFVEAVKAGEQEGFTVCLVNGEILSWVVKFKGPVS
jgi:hypothetical protein